MTPEKLEQLVALVRLMRRAQKLYFRTRSPTHLEDCKLLESKVDRALGELAATPGLFDRPAGEGTP
jgi:hypothetical protein